MRVLFWAGTLWPHIGGVEVLASKLLPALRDRGYQFLVVAPKNHPDLPDEAEYQGIPVHRFPFGTTLMNNDLEQLTDLHQRISQLKRVFAPDLIHINAVGMSDFFHLTTRNAHPAPVLVTLHQALPDSIQRDTLSGQLLCTADWITCCSTAVLDRSRQLAPEITPRSSVIHNALDAPSVLPTPLSFEPPRLLCLGRLVSEKGFDLAVTACAALAHRFPDARLVIAGDGQDRKRLEQQVVELGLTHSVELVGWIAPDDVPSLINTSTVVVIPSRWMEPFCLVALEAALMARPVVATHVGGLPEVVVHEETGLLVEKENSQALAEAIALLLTHPERARHMGQAARRRAVEKFSWDRYVDAYDALYREIVNDQSRSV